jgi:hypothetical protein
MDFIIKPLDFFHQFFLLWCKTQIKNKEESKVEDIQVSVTVQDNGKAYCSVLQKHG